VKALAPNLYSDWLHRFAYFTRPMTQFMSNKLNAQNLVGVEIGVWAGIHAESMLTTLPIAKLYLIDPYLPYMYEGKLLHPERHLAEAKERLSKFGDKVVFIKKKSVDAVPFVPNDLDFVFVDGDHSHSAVKNDIAMYYPKIRVGGILGGRDYCGLPRVFRAVMQFSCEYGLTLHSRHGEWWIIKE